LPSHRFRLAVEKEEDKDEDGDEENLGSKGKESFTLEWKSGELVAHWV
jgi:hypothetical protein